MDKEIKTRKRAAVDNPTDVQRTKMFLEFKDDAKGIIDGIIEKGSCDGALLLADGNDTQFHVACVGNLMTVAGMIHQTIQHEPELGKCLAKIMLKEELQKALESKDIDRMGELISAAMGSHKPKPEGEAG